MNDHASTEGASDGGREAGPVDEHYFRVCGGGIVCSPLSSFAGVGNPAMGAWMRGNSKGPRSVSMDRGLLRDEVR